MSRLATSKAEQRNEDNLEALGEKLLRQRMVRALRRTNQVIGLDMGWNEREPSKATLREIVPDGDSLEQFGNDKEAVAAFRKLDKADRTRVLKEAFP